MSTATVNEDVCATCGCDGNCGFVDTVGADAPEFAPQQVRAWLDRQHCKPGGVTAETRAMVEGIISDLEAGDF